MAVSGPAKPRLLVLTSTFPRWDGDPTPGFVFELCRRLVRRFEVSVLAPHAPGAAVRENLHGVDVHRYRYAPQRLERLAYEGGILPRLRNRPWWLLLVPMFVVAQGLAARRLARDHDVVHAHWLLPQGLVAVTVTGRPVLATAHGGDLFGLRSVFAGRLRHWVLRRVDRLTVVSQALRDVLCAEGFDTARTVVAPMGVDLRDSFVPAGEREQQGQPRLLFVGRLVAKKGVATLLRALPQILEHVPGASLEVVGDGPERDALCTLAAELGVAEAVDFVGALPQARLPDRFRAATVVVFPSEVAADGDREGFGLVAVEALGCGCAVVASDLPAMREFLVDGETALVTPAGDPAALAVATVRLLGDPGLRERLGRAGREHVLARYDWEAVASSYADLLGTLARRAGHTGERS